MRLKPSTAITPSLLPVHLVNIVRVFSSLIITFLFVKAAVTDVLNASCFLQKMLLKKNCGGKTRTIKIRVSSCLCLIFFVVVFFQPSTLRSRRTICGTWHFVHTGDTKGEIPSILLFVCENDCNCGHNRLRESPQQCCCCCDQVAVVPLIVILSFFLFTHKKPELTVIR